MMEEGKKNKRDRVRHSRPLVGRLEVYVVRMSTPRSWASLLLLSHELWVDNFVKTVIRVCSFLSLPFLVHYPVFLVKTNSFFQQLSHDPRGSTLRNKSFNPDGRFSPLFWRQKRRKQEINVEKGRKTFISAYSSSRG